MLIMQCAFFIHHNIQGWFLHDINYTLCWYLQCKVCLSIISAKLFWTFPYMCFMLCYMCTIRIKMVAWPTCINSVSCKTQLDWLFIYYMYSVVIVAFGIAIKYTTNNPAGYPSTQYIIIVACCYYNYINRLD